MGFVAPYSSPALQKAVLANRLAAVTRKNYEERLNTMRNATGLSVKHMLAHPLDTYNAMRLKSNDVPQTMRSYLVAFLALFKHDPRLMDRSPNDYLQFKAFFQEVDKVVTERYNSNSPTDRQREAYMPLHEVLAKRDALDKNSTEYLILCLYTMIPPLRADFGNVSLLPREPTDATQATAGNYLVVRPQYIRLVLNDFKSKSRSLPQYNKVLPRDLEHVIRDSLARHPRSHLIVSPRNGLPFLRDNTYVVFVHRALHKALGKKISISLLRHIYVSAQDYNAMTSGDKCALSADMLHSTTTNDRYRLHF